jgi:ADP-ribosyl-[dinitrogen reductase] hydrolase
LRTSDTDPIKIPAIILGNNKIGLSFCPGKYQPQAQTGAWDRSMEKDLARIREHGYDVIVSLIDRDYYGRDEFELLKVTELKQGIVESYDMKWLWIPIVDCQIPDGSPSDNNMGEIIDLLRHDFSVFIHCKGGLGRAGLVSAWVLTHFGLTAEEAIAKIRLVRPRAIENITQENWVKKYASIK